MGSEIQLLLTFTTLRANLTDDIFFYFNQTTGSDISCKLSPLETICMKCQNLFAGENKFYT